MMAALRLPTAMSTSCCPPPSPSPSSSPRFRRALWIALAVNLGMFLVEAGASFVAGSVSLLADAIDFFGDAANYGISLAVLGATLAARAKATMVKAVTMASFAAFVLGKALWSMVSGTAPNAMTMGAVAMLALAANVGVALLLYRHRAGDSNMRSVWLCSRNDAIGNVAVALAAVGVFGTGSAAPDLVVAGLMAALAAWSSASLMRQALAEWRSERNIAPTSG